jgi:hypothetical protein
MSGSLRETLGRAAQTTVGRAGRLALLASTLLVPVACQPGLTSGIDYPDTSDVELVDHLLSPEGDEDPSVSLSNFKFSAKSCEGVDTRMSTGELDQEDLTRFFASRGLNLKPRKARGDLFWYEIQSQEEGDEEPRMLRLRLAVLSDRYAAAKDLHDSLLQHGPGWWGVRRSNLALLAPKASLDEALKFAVKYKLHCWGAFTYTGVDDAYVVSGGYTEF